MNERMFGRVAASCRRGNLCDSGSGAPGSVFLTRKLHVVQACSADLCYVHSAPMRVVTGWRLALALLIAVSTALLFATGSRMRILEGASEEVCSFGQHDVPVVSRQQDSFDR